MAFDGCCPDCKLPGDDCPLGTKCCCMIAVIFISDWTVTLMGNQSQLYFKEPFNLPRTILSNNIFFRSNILCVLLYCTTLSCGNSRKPQLLLHFVHHKSHKQSPRIECRGHICWRWQFPFIFTLISVYHAHLMLSFGTELWSRKVSKKP